MSGSENKINGNDNKKSLDRSNSPERSSSPDRSNNNDTQKELRIFTRLQKEECWNLA